MQTHASLSGGDVPVFGWVERPFCPECLEEMRIMRKQPLAYLAKCERCRHLVKPLVVKIIRRLPDDGYSR